eukprot:1400433-Pyramimonas_sp.AAC.1
MRALQGIVSLVEISPTSFTLSPNWRRRSTVNLVTAGNLVELLSYCRESTHSQKNEDFSKVSKFDFFDVYVRSVPGSELMQKYIGRAELLSE